LAPAPVRAQAQPEQRIDVVVRGPLAVVDVSRSLTFGAEALRAAADEVVVDLDLPEGARLQAVQIASGASGEARRPGGPRRQDPVASLDLAPPGKQVAGAEAQKSYLAFIDAGGGRRARVPVDEGADFRLRVAAPGLGEGAAAASWTLRYRFIAPLECRGGEMVLGMPASLDPAPAPARVSVRVIGGDGPPALRLVRVGPASAGAAATIVAGAGPAERVAPLSRAPVPTAAPWEVALRLGSGRAQASAARPTLYALSAAGRAGATGASGLSEGVLVAALCRPPVVESALHPPASHLLLLLDRSRSMGPGGAASARDLARALALALPPSLTFNVVAFDRQAEALFPVARSATLEALRGLDDALGMGALRNGTALVPALRRTAHLLASDSQRRGDPGYLVIVTDGALGDEDRGPALAEAVRGLGAPRLQTAVLILRQDEDERAAAGDRRALATVPARTGGILRELGPRALAEVAPGLIAALRAGGDVLDPRLVAPAVPGPEAALDQTGVGPGAGARLTVRVPGPVNQVRLRASYGGRPLEVGSRPAPLAAADARALLAAAPSPRVLVGEQAAALLIPVNAQDPATPVAARGQMDRDVVHKQLAYSYLPRARACYLTRSIKTARDFQLRGRLRLELHLERGEMVGAVVRRSTLGRPDIEACLREAAFAVEIPRALANDAPVLAALNLVLQPRTQARAPDAGTEGTPLGGEQGRQMAQEIDRIIGPLGPASDPLELLVE
jgi:hypothetical protein